MADLPRGIKHVDRNALYTDLAARVSYLKDFIELGPGRTPISSTCYVQLSLTLSQMISLLLSGDRTSFAW